MSNASFEIEDRIAAAATATPFFTRASAWAEDARQAGAEPVNGDGFYRFKIGDFQATVISDGYGQLPVRPILVMNASEAELAPVLKANFMTSSWRVQACRQGVPALATAKCRLVTRWHRDEGSASQASLTRSGKGRYARRASWSD